MSGVRVARVDDIQPGQLKLVEIDGTRVVLARVGEAIYACGEACAHRGGPLSDGKLNGAKLVCPWHGWIYDVRTGRCLFPGRGAQVAPYPVQVEGGEIWVAVPPLPAPGAAHAPHDESH